MYRSIFILLVAAALTVPGCAPTPVSDPAGPAAPVAKPGDPASATPAALLSGRTLTWGQLHAPLVEAAGGPVLVEIVLDQAVAQRLAEHGLAVTPAQVAAERAILAESLSADPDQAQRLLTGLRGRRGLGPVRFEEMLTRNAGLRLLVQDQVLVSAEAERQAYELEYGPKVLLRLIVVDGLADAADIQRRLAAGESFAELAATRSRDDSRDRGGLLSPLSLADPTYPAAIRGATGNLAALQVSPPVALDHGYGIIKLERKIDATAVRFDDVEGALKVRVRRRVEQMLMRRLGRELMDQVDVTVLDPQLDAGWKQQRKLFTTEP